MKTINEIKTDIQHRIAKLLIKWYLTKGFQTHRMKLKAKTMATLKGQDTSNYADAEQEGVTITKQGIAILLKILVEFIPDFDENTLTKGSAIFIYNCGQEIAEGLRRAQANYNINSEEFLEHPGYNNDDFIDLIDRGSKAAAITMNADSYYDDAGFMVLLRLFLIFREQQRAEDAKCMEANGMDWLDTLLDERACYNTKIFAEKLSTHTGEEFEVIKINNNYEIIKKEVNANGKHRSTIQSKGHRLPA